MLVCAGLLGVLASAACGGALREQTATAVTAAPRLGDIRPPASAIPLPADRAAGDGVAVYRPGRTKGPVYLVTSTGTQYELPVLGTTAPPSPVPSPGASAVEPVPPEAFEVDPMTWVSLSPDGRYLARPVYPRMTEIRDLRSTAVLRLAGGELPQAWSADGSRLVVRVPDGGFKESYVAVEISTGVRTSLKACTGLALGAVLADGLVLCVPPRGNMEDRFVPRVPGVADFRVETPDGQVRREFHVDLRDRLTESGQPMWFQDVSADGRQVLISVLERTFVASAEDGSVSAEVVPPKEPGWLVAGFHGDHVYLRRLVEVGSPSPISEPVVYAAWNPHGYPEAQVTFPAGALVQLTGRVFS